MVGISLFGCFCFYLYVLVCLCSLGKEPSSEYSPLTKKNAVYSMNIFPGGVCSRSECSAAPEGAGWSRCDAFAEIPCVFAEGTVFAVVAGLRGWAATASLHSGPLKLGGWVVGSGWVETSPTRVGCRALPEDHDIMLEPHG